MRLSALLLAATLVSGTAMASDDYAGTSPDEPSAGAMTFDILFMRPLGLVSLALGSAVFIVQAPLSLFHENGLAKSFDALVADPAHYTFVRPMGSEH